MTTTNTAAASFVITKHYAKRDPEAQGDHYINHVSAMTTEGLHAKSDIAAELAHRDIEIERLRAALAAPAQAAGYEILVTLDSAMAAIDHVAAHNCESREREAVRMLVTPAAPAQAGEYPPLVCDYCGALTPDPWHSSGMLRGKMSKHIHSCDACAAQGAAQAAPVDAENEIDLLAEAALCERLDACLAAARAALAAPAQPAPSASVEQEAMQMLWDDQQQEEKEHYRNVARGIELPLYAIHHPEDIDKTKRRAAPPEQPVAPANVDSAPLYLSLNDRAMWVLGWNACLDKARAAQKAAAQAAHLHAQPLWRTDAEIVEQTEILARYLLSWKWGLHPESPDAQLRISQNTKAQKAWNAACEIQDLLTATDVENAVAEVDDAARAAQGAAHD